MTKYFKATTQFPHLITPSPNKFLLLRRAHDNNSCATAKMCYAFSESFEEQAALLVTGECVLGSYSYQTGSAAATAKDDTVSLKRRASSSLEHEPKKASKLSADDDPAEQAATKANDDATSSKGRGSTSPEHQPKSVGKTSKGNGCIGELGQSGTNGQAHSSGEDLSELKKELARAQDRNKTLESKLAHSQEFEDECHGLRVETAFQKENTKGLTEKLQTAASEKKGINLALSKTLETEAKKKYEKKLENQQKRHDAALEDMRQKHQNALNKKQKASEEKFEACKQKHQEQQEAKDAAQKTKLQECKDKNQQLKDETAAEKKRLRTEQQDEIKKWKPQHSDNIKKMERLLKEKQTVITRLEKKIEKLESDKTTLDKKGHESNDRIKTLQAVVDEAKVRSQDLQTRFNTQGDVLKEWQKANADLTRNYDAKLDYEGRRWQLQYNKGEQLSFKLVHQQRSNFVLRNTNNRNAKRIEELEVGLKAAKEEFESYKAAATTVDDALTTIGGCDGDRRR